MVNAPTAAAGRFVPPGCVGPIMALGVAGGNCSVDPSDGSVACTQPSVRLTVTPLTCNLPYRSGCKFGGVQLRKTVPLGPRAGGYLGPQPALYQVGWDRLATPLEYCPLSDTQGQGAEMTQHRTQAKVDHLCTAELRGVLGAGGLLSVQLTAG